MRLDTKTLRYLTNEDWRVLTAVEQGSKNHEVVPTPLIIQLSGLRGGSGVHRSISTLAKANLIARLKNAKYDGYRLTYGGLDYLALHTHQKRDIIYSVGNQIGVGKESDIFVVAPPPQTPSSSTSHSVSNSQQKREQLILKIHRLGRISFRTVKTNRDYLRHRSAGSWMYMSRLAASKEYSFMTALREVGMPVPRPVAQNRHTLVMELIDAFPLRQISSVPDPPALYAELIGLILRLAGLGVIHGDFNEFNILIKEEHDGKSRRKREDDQAADAVDKVHTEAVSERNDDESSKEEALTDKSELSTSQVRLVPVLIDFPQMLSMDHADAEFYFNRDVQCIKTFFRRRFGFTSDESGPTYNEARERISKDGTERLDVQVEATGFSRKMAKELEAYSKAVGVDGDREAATDGSPILETAESSSLDDIEHLEISST